MQKLCSALVVLAALSACGGSDAIAVEMTEAQRFDPAQLTVAPGDVISFNNTSSEAHTVTAYSGEIPDRADYFSSGGLSSEDAARDDLTAALIPAGETYEVTLQEPGTYRYFCIPHESAGMKGIIVVEG